MRLIIAASRMLLGVLVIMLGMVACLFSVVMSEDLFAWLECRWHRTLARALGVKLRYEGCDLVPGALVLGNHISWLDISLVGGRWNVTFLGKSEIASWPVLGWIVRRAGTLFIERGRGAARAVLDIEAELKGGRSVVLFAEGTTTDGFSVRRFHSRLLQAALETASPVQPMAIRYFDATGERTRIPSYAGEVTLLQSVWRTVSEPGVVAELTLFDPIPPEEERHLLARHAEGVVRSRVMQGLPRV